jgi:hypothetical protein
LNIGYSVTAQVGAAGIGTGMSDVGARKPPTRRATVGVLAIVTTAGARSRREGITVSLSVH